MNKWFQEGCITNLLLFLTNKDEVDIFKKISISMSRLELLEEIGVDKLSPNVENNRDSMDPFYKCLWIL